MAQPKSAMQFSRRQAISLGVTVAGGFAGAMIAGCASPGTGVGQNAPGGSTLPNASTTTTGNSVTSVASLQTANLSESTVHEIEEIIQAQGNIDNGLLHISIDRDDIPNVHLHGVPILPSFEINGDLYFQCLGGDQVIMNSDLCVKASEIDPFIDQLIAHDIVFQAEHQHFYDFDPLVWFIHFRAKGNAETIARGVKAALNVTSTPFPQSPPKNPTTPLPAEELGDILGAKPSVGSNGVVTFDIARAEPIILGGTRVNPYLNMSTPIAFQPYGGGQNAAAVPDFGMIPSEINRVVGLMRSRGWDIGCLYNQETDEQPQLFFSHQFKTGNALELAREIRAGLALMNVTYEKV